jgi:hypothetical protein
MYGFGEEMRILRKHKIRYTLSFLCAFQQEYTKGVKIGGRGDSASHQIWKFSLYYEVLSTLLTLTAKWLLYVLSGFTLKNSVCCPQSSFTWCSLIVPGLNFIFPQQHLF